MTSDPSRRHGLHSRPFLIVVVLLVGGAFWWWDRHLPDAIGIRETEVIDLMKRVNRAQEAFVAARVIDQDGDGVGEFGYLAELLGLQGSRFSTNEAPAAAFLELRGAELVATADGAVIRHAGYFFRIYLPVAGGGAMPEPSVSAGARAADADSQERAWIVYAWPEHLGSTGNRAFVTGTPAYDCPTVCGSRHVLATANLGAQGYDGLKKIPAATACLSASGGRAPELLTGELGNISTGQDGSVWLGPGC